MNVRRLNRRSRAVLSTGAMVLATLVGLVTPAGAVDITSSGPLTTVGVTPDLRCSANHVGDTSGEFYGGTSCGTFISFDSTLYGWLGAALTPVSQTDTYTTGLESFRTGVRVDNTSGASHAVRVYRAADCYLQTSDQGYGVADTTSSSRSSCSRVTRGSRVAGRSADRSWTGDAQVLGPVGSVVMITPRRTRRSAASARCADASAG